MPLEEGIVAWSGQRPRWQQIMLRGVAEGRPLSGEALEQLVDAVVTGERLTGGGLEIGHLVASASDAPPVRLTSVAEPAHVNALSSSVPLTFLEDGITIVYGDNGSGKSGYARLLKRIARSRHNETVLTDVFRDTPGLEPTAKTRSTNRPGVARGQLAGVETTGNSAHAVLRQCVRQRIHHG